MKTTENLTIEQRQALIEENKRQLAVQEAMLKNEEKKLKALEDAKAHFDKTVKVYQAEEKAYRKYYAELKKCSSAVLLEEKETVLQKTPSAYLMQDNGEWATVYFESEKFTQKITKCSLYYRSHLIEVSIHVTEGEGYSRGYNRGYKMRWGERHIAYGARWYTVAQSVIDKIDEKIDSEEREKKAKLEKNNLFETAMEDLRKLYPHASITKDTTGYYTDNSRNNWYSYNIIKIEFPNGSYITMTVSKSRGEESDSPYVLVTQRIYDAELTKLGTQDKIAYLSKQNR